MNLGGQISLQFKLVFNVDGSHRRSSGSSTWLEAQMADL